jgi:putative zinc finger protein
MNAVAPRLDCDRVREWASLDLDGELSDFERVLMDGHLALCADCSSFRASITGFTDRLRAVPLELSERPVVVRRSRRAISFRRVPAAAAALVVAVVGVATLLSSAELRGVTESAPWARPGDANDATNLIRQTGDQRPKILLQRRRVYQQPGPVRARQLRGGPVRG